MNPLSALPAQAQAPQTPAVQPKVVVQQPKSAPAEQKKAPEVKVDAAGEAAATAAKAKAEVNVEQYARATKEVMRWLLSRSRAIFATPAETLTSRWMNPPASTLPGWLIPRQERLSAHFLLRRHCALPAISIRCAACL